ncbi:MAG: tetratricopeptide repeat protein, partial [Spirochaetia bacterium]|nr:tetratricopeptide repeat protein [Spirochaetia bacterium]
MNPRKSLLLYLLVVFCLGLILFLFLILRNLQFSFNSDKTASEARQFSFRTEIVSVNTFYKNQQYEQALSLLSRFDDHDLNPGQKHAADMMRAACHKALGLYTTALEDVERAARAKETSFSHFLKGLILEASGSEVNALGAFQDALRLDAEYAPAQERVGDIHFRSGNYEKAYTAYASRKNSERPLSDSALLKQAVCRYFLGQDAEAGRLSGVYLAKAKNQKDMEVAYLIRALSFSAQGQTREAEEAHEKAIAVAQVGSRAFLKYYYALHLLRQKNYPQAVKLLEEIAFVDGDRNAVANYTLGQIFFRSQDFEKSLRYFDRNR